jgi:uncharacterized protein YjbJ (UPF0337 family)
MTNDVYKGKWKRIQGRVREEWGRFTNNNASQVHGKSDQLVGRLQERYGALKRKLRSNRTTP